MRPMKYAALSLLLFSASLLLATRSKAQSSVDESAGPQGTGARTSADQYHSHAQRDGVSVGAEILTPKRVEKSFASDVNRCCIVVEFALYPKKGETLDLWLNDFELYVAGGDIPMKPVSASAVAGWVQNKNSDGTPVSATVDVEYENPPSKVHGSYSTTDAGADVSPNTEAGSTPTNTEEELGAKGLPEGKAAGPVAGYLYFLIPKRDKNAKYQLEYTLRDERLVLALP
jgi:hypothetical protein